MSRRKSRKNRDFIEKSRTLATDYGDTGDNLYYTASGGNNSFASSAPDADMLNVYAYGLVRRDTAISPVALSLGTEYLGSTTRPRPTYNDCTHYKSVSLNYPYAIRHAGYDGFGLYWRFYWRERLVSDQSQLRRSAEDLRKMLEDDSGFAARAYWSMRPKFEGKVSLINSIFELKDFKDVAKNLVKTGSLIKDAVDLYKSRKYSHGLKRQDPSRSAADGWLTWQLAIKPTIRDFLAISAQAMVSAKEAQDRFKQDGLDGKTSHYREFISTEDMTTQQPYNNYIHAIGEYSRTIRNASASMTYDYTSRATLEAIMYYWGLTGSAEALWNMIPLSFVIDYFITIGKLLNMVERDNNVVLTSYRYCESALHYANAGIHAVVDPRVVNLCINNKIVECNSSMARKLISGNSRSIYVRIAKEPYQGPPLPKLRLPSNTQMVNLGALALSLLT